MPDALRGLRGRLAARPLLIQLGFVLAGVLLLRARWPTLHDLVVAIDHGEVLFADFVNHYYPTAERALEDSTPVGGFFYPAAFAVLIVPLGWLSAPEALLAWGLVQLGCVLWAATALVRAGAPDRPLLAALGSLLAITSVPVLHSLKWGQVSLLILAAVGGAFLAYARGHRWLAAGLLGVATAIKGYPLVFAAWFALRGDLRFLARAADACLFTLIVLPAVVMGPEHALAFQRASSGAVLGAADGVLRDFNSQYAPAVLSRYVGGWDAAPREVIAWAEAGSLLTLVVITLLAVVAARSTAPRIAARRDLFGFVLVACSVPFWLKTSWSHYFVHLPVAQTMLAAAFARGEGEGRPLARDAMAIGVTVVPSMYLSSVLALFATKGWWYYANAGSLFFANALVLVACAVFLADAHGLRLAGRASR